MIYVIGFSQISDDALALSGTKDIYSSGAEKGFVSTASSSKEEYYSPESQVNKTTNYNEMDFYRIQEGQRKQPDYIIVFRENSEVKYMEEAKKAQEQWGGLPIVVIDKDKCLESERQKVEALKQRYESGDKSVAGEIYQKVRNNRVTRSTFCEEIDIEKFKEEAESQKQQEEEQKKEQQEKQKEIKENYQQVKSTERKVSVEDLDENYDKTTPQERKQEVSAIRRINTQIQQIVNEKEGEEVGG